MNKKLKKAMDATREGIAESEVMIRLIESLPEPKEGDSREAAVFMKKILEAGLKANKDILEEYEDKSATEESEGQKVTQQLINKRLEEVEQLGGAVEDFKAKNIHLKGKELFLEIERELDGLRADYGLASDEFELHSLIERRGKDWIEKKLQKFEKVADNKNNNKK